MFIDCSGVNCDQNYIRTEINLVDFLAERSAADVHILITSTRTGGSTDQYQLIFYGQNIFKTYLDTLRFTTAPNASTDEVRTQLIHFIKTGLAPFISKTSYAYSFSIQMKQDTVVAAVKPTKDKWNYIVFNVNAEGAVSADQNYTNQRGTAGFSMNRTTDKTRFQISSYASKYIYTYKVEDAMGTQKYEVNNSDFSILHLLVKSLSQHFSLGYTTSLSNNTFQNTKIQWYLHPVLELNLFKYNEVNNRSFVLRYGVDYSFLKYYDTTLFNRDKEHLYGQEVSLSINLNQKWGSFNSGAYYRNYFKDRVLYSTGADI